jgi:hypothetical protein
MAILTRDSDLEEEVIYIDDVFDTFMPKSGGTFTGDVSMGDNILTVPTPPLPSGT